jgi:hypothetical protein
VLPGSLVVLAEERFSLSTFQSFATGPTRPLRDRTVIVERKNGATYPELVKVVDALILGKCLDIRVVEPNK